MPFGTSDCWGELCVPSCMSPSDGIFNKHMVDRVYCGARLIRLAPTAPAAAPLFLYTVMYTSNPKRCGFWRLTTLLDLPSACTVTNQRQPSTLIVCIVQRCWEASKRETNRRKLFMRARSDPIVNESCAVLLNGPVTVLGGKWPQFWINFVRLHCLATFIFISVSIVSILYRFRLSRIVSI